MPQPVRGRGSKNGREQGGSILADHFCRSLLLSLTCRKVLALDPMPIAMDPRRITVLLDPFRSSNRQTVECCSERFADTDQAIQRSNFREYMGGVGALASTRLQPSLVFEQREHGVQQEMVHSPIRTQYLHIKRQNPDAILF